MRTWIKLYTEILHDPKMHALSDKQFRACVNLFALAGYTDNEGEIGTLDDVKFHLRLPLRDAQAIVNHLESVGILQFDGSKYTVTAFYKRNGTSPSQSNDRVLQRVKSYRARKQGDSEISNDGVTPLHSERNESVTTLDKNRIDKNIEASADKPRKPADDTCPKEWMTALYSLSKIDAATATIQARKNLSDCGKALVKSGATIEQVATFERNWYSQDWRGKQGQAPTVKQVRDEWGKYSQPMSGNGNGNGHTPQIDPARQAALAKAFR